MEDRALVGKIVVTESCEFEFIPASTSVKYKCELIGLFRSLSVVTAIISNEYVIINKWVWLTASAAPTIAIDAAAVGLNPTATIRQTFQSSVEKCLTGQVHSVSSFLRIKDTNDPFHNSFVVHLMDGNSVILRGKKFVLFRNFLEPKSVIEFFNFRRIKLKSFNDKIVYISVDDSYVGKIDTFNPSLLPAEPGSKVRGRIVAIDPPHVWITPLSEVGPMRVLPMVMNRWGLCDKRKICLGAVITVHNYHIIHGVIGFCPASTLLVIEDLPPVSTPVPIHSMCASVSARCLIHNMDGSGVCDAKSTTKFGINTLCECDCVIQCEAVKDDLVKTLTHLTQGTQRETKQAMHVNPPGPDINEVFLNALQSSEVCLSLTSLAEVLLLKAPPFFNVSIDKSVQITVNGPPSPETTQYMKGFPSALVFSIFPHNRPINAFLSATVHSQRSKGTEVALRVLVPRDASIDTNTKFSIRQMLVVNGQESGTVHAIILNKENLIQVPNEGVHSDTHTIPSPSKAKHSRRLLLRRKIWESEV